MLSSSRLSSLTPCPVTHSPDHASFLQPPPSPFLLINCARSLHQPQTVADTGSEPTSRSLSPPQPGFATHSGNSSHMNLPETPIRVASQPSCPPAPKRHPPLRLYGGDSTNDTGGTCDGTSDNTARPSRGNSRDPRPHLPAGTDDTAASLRQMVATAAAVSSPQDMLCRLRPDAPKVAHPEMAHSAGSLPVLAIPVPGCLQTYDNPSTLRARRLKLFGQARSSFLTIKCLCSSSTEVLPPASSQPRPLTIRTDPPTVQTDSPTDRTDLVGFAKRHSSGLPGRCVALRTQSDPGVRLRSCACTLFSVLFSALCRVKSAASNLGCFLAYAAALLMLKGLARENIITRVAMGPHGHVFCLITGRTCLALVNTSPVPKSIMCSIM